MASQRSTAIPVHRQMAARPIRAGLAIILLLGSAMALAQVAWPVLTLPSGIEPFDMGGEMQVNGLPLRMRGLLSAKTPSQVAALLRASLGQPLVEHTQGTKLVLGRGMGEFYATVQLEPAGAGTRGLIAITRLSTASTERNSLKETGQRALSRFPSGSRLLSRTNSDDGKRHGEFLAVTNTHGPELNVAHVKRMLDAQGYTLERASAQENSGNAAPPHGGRGATTLLFKRADGEAMAVIYRDAGGATAIVLNTITYLEYVK